MFIFVVERRQERAGEGWERKAELVKGVRDGSERRK